MTDESPEGEQICALCAGTGKIKVTQPLPTSHGAATNVIFDLEMLKDLKVICGT